MSETRTGAWRRPRYQGLRTCESRPVAGPAKTTERLGAFDAATIAGADPENLVEVFKQTPAVHRFPGSMAERTQALCAALVADWGGDAARIWTDGDPDGATVLARLKALPGFGEQKAKIFVALLGLYFLPFLWRLPRPIATMRAPSLLR